MFDTIALPETLAVFVVASALALVGWPAMRIADRIGWPRWVGLLAFVPVFNVVLLWMVAYAPWPATAPRR